MDQFDREDSSAYRQNGQSQPTDGASQQPEQPPVRQAYEPKKSKAPLILTILLLLALIGAGVLGWLWFQQNERVSDLESDVASARVEVEKLEDAAKTTEDQSEEPAVVTDTNSSSSDTILTEAISYSAARTGNQGFVNGTQEREGKIEKQTTQFAKVIVSSPTSPGTETVYLKASNDGWVVIGDGTEDTSNLQNSFGLPAGF